MTPVRYRAYALTKTVQTAAVRNDAGEIQFDASGEPVTKVVSETAVEDVVFAGDMSGNEITIDAGNITVSKVVVYAGEPDAEVVAGCHEVNASGSFTIHLDA